MPPDDTTLALIAALEAAGHAETAASVRDRALADQLRDRHPDLAEALVGRSRPGAPDRGSAHLPTGLTRRRRS